MGLNPKQNGFSLKTVKTSQNKILSKMPINNVI